MPDHQSQPPLPVGQGRPMASDKPCSGAVKSRLAANSSMATLASSLPPAMQVASHGMAFLGQRPCLRWTVVKSLKIRSLAVRHGGLVRLGISFVLNALCHTLMALTAGELSLGLASLHAMTIVYLGSTMFAMTTRISSGHGGRRVAADDTAGWSVWSPARATAS